MMLLSGYEGLSTHFYVEVFQPVEDEEHIRNLLISEIDRFGKVYSRFKEDSIVSVLVRDGVVPYDHCLAEMLRESCDMSDRTEGIFSLFVAKKLQDKGYGVAVTSEVDSSRCGVDVSETEIRLKGGSLDLGGIGKGYLIDRLAEILTVHGIQYFLINAGGDMYATSDNGNPVEVYLEEPKTRNGVFGKISLYHQALCCSSSYVRAWMYEGERKNHFITKTGDEVWSASYVVGDSATQADMLATVFCIIANDEQKIASYLKLFSVSVLVYTEQTDSLQGNLKFIPR